MASVARRRDGGQSVIHARSFTAMAGPVGTVILTCMDVLSDILGHLRLQGSLYFTTDFRPPWGLRVPRFGRVARFHLVVRGGCWVRVIGAADPLRLETGDLVLIPNGAEHVLADTPDTPCRTVDEVVRQAGFTGRGALTIAGDDSGSPTRMVCGHFAFDEAFDHPLVQQLPDAMLIRWDDYARDSPLEQAFQFIVREVQAGRPGNAAVVNRLSEVLFVQAIRWWIEHQPAERGMLAALTEPGLASALGAIHAEPTARWTVEELGQRAAMGRTAFAGRFRDVIGMTPMEYVTLWRMQRAKRLLTESRLSLEQVASRAGYDSAASFSRVFTRETGVRPGAYRRQAG